MDVRQLFLDASLKQEFLDRFTELSEQAQNQIGGFEGLEGGPGIDDAAAVVDDISEGTYSSGRAPGIEAIIERFTRPVYLVQQSTFRPPGDTLPNSEEIQLRLEDARSRLERVIPSAGRIDLRHHRLDWVGTGWMVAPGIVATNRHVAREFASRGDNAFHFRQEFGSPPVKATLDWRHEYQCPEESLFRVQDILSIEPERLPDLALLRVSSQGDDGEPQPPPISLMTRDEIDEGGVGSWIAVVGYPAYDSRNDAADQQRIFDGIYNVKRLAPGKVTAIAPGDMLDHDATTLGGNSGSVVIDLESGKAMALHFGGIEGDRNSAIQAPYVEKALAPFTD